MTLYDVLGVPPDASPEALRLAYYRKVRQYHPDTRQGASTGQGDTSLDDAGRVREIIEAYRVLRDPIARAAYDQSHRPQRQRPGTADATGGHAAETVRSPASSGDPVDLLRAVGPVRRHDKPASPTRASTTDGAQPGVARQSAPGAAMTAAELIDWVSGHRDADQVVDPVWRAWFRAWLG